MNNYYKKKSKINISFPGSIESELDLNNINDTKRKLEEIIQKKGGKNVRDLIDKYFSISWCENNLVVPVSSTFDKSLDVEIIKIAVADFSYIDSLSVDIKKQLNKKNARCEFKELEIKEINKILALAKNERSTNKETISDFDLNPDSSTKESFKDINSDIDELIDIGNLDFESPDD